MKKLTIMMATAALCCCLGSCNSGTKQELANTVHLIMAVITASCTTLKRGPICCLYLAVIPTPGLITL